MLFFLLIMLRRPTSTGTYTLLPYTTLFRSNAPIVKRTGNGGVMNDALAKRTDLVRAFIDERVHPAISGTENRDRFASLYRQRTRAKSWQLVNRANIKPFCGHGSTSSNDRERSDFCDVLVQVPDRKSTRLNSSH